MRPATRDHGAGLSRSTPSSSPHGPEQLAPPCIREDRVELAPGELLRQVAGGRAAALGPGATEHALVLAGGVAPFGHPAVTGLALLAKDVAADGCGPNDAEGGRRSKSIRKPIRARLGNADRLADSPSALTELYLALARPASAGRL